MYGADPTEKHPMKGFPQICFIKNTVSNPKIIIDDYTYYDDPEDSENFERNVLYHYPFSEDKLIIGKFCALARGVKFIMNGANHKISGFSTYPFQIFGNGWEKVTPQPHEYPFKGDTVVGNDVWIDQRGMLASADGPKVAFLWGNPQDNQLNGTLVKLPTGFTGKIRSQGSTLRAVAIQGRPKHRVPGKVDVKTMEPGSYFSSKGESVHQVSCEGGEECIMYVRIKG